MKLIWMFSSVTYIQGVSSWAQQLLTKNQHKVPRWPFSKFAIHSVCNISSNFLFFQMIFQKSEICKMSKLDCFDVIYFTKTLQLNNLQNDPSRVWLSFKGKVRDWFFEMQRKFIHLGLSNDCSSSSKLSSNRKTEEYLYKLSRNTSNNLEISL